MTAAELRDFAGYLRNCTDRQVFGVLHKELADGREDYAELARIELRARGFTDYNRPI